MWGNMKFLLHLLKVTWQFYLKLGESYMHSPSKALLLTTCRRLWQTSSIRLSTDSLHNGCVQFLYLTKVLGISSFAYRILPLFHLSCYTSIASERDCCKGWTLPRLVIRYKHIRWFKIWKIYLQHQLIWWFHIWVNCATDVYSESCW